MVRTNLIWPGFCRAVRASLFALASFSLISIAPAQDAKTKAGETPIHDADADHEQQRAAWFLRGRVAPGKSAAELRRHAYQAKMQARTDHLSRTHTARVVSQLLPSQTASPAGGWVPLGPVPLASDATGDGFQDYHQVSGRATAVAIDPADPSGNTVYIGGAQGGLWKSVNAATSIANNVAWTAITDDQPTLSIGSIAIQPGNSIPANSVILVGTGEADNSVDSYFGLGILRSADGGNAWALISTANSGTLSFSGLGAARMAFSTASISTVVAAMGATAEGVTEDALTSNTERGLYTSTDAGQTWTYDALFSGAGEATSATSVVYNASAGRFFAALRYHGFYSSPDGLSWTLLPNQPGVSGLLSASACPQNYSINCPIYRGEITVVPGRNEMYAWFISLDTNGNPVDQGIWQSINGGASWLPINDSGIINCGDFSGCGVEQGFYNLELLAIPNGTSATDLYAGAINLYKCSISSINSNCSATPFMNLTHAYGCDPLGALAHVHPDQHALAYTIPNAGSDPDAALMYFANDGGIYRALNGFTGLGTASCSGTNQFDDLNQNLGSMTQFVSFSQDPTDPNTLLGGTQDNGSPATATAAATDTAWGNVLSGDGGYNAIDPNTGNWFASNPDTGSGTLDIQECSSGIGCNDSLFNVVVSSSDVGGDDGTFYFPFILDPQSPTALLVGTCRVWSGPRSGGAFTLLSLNFDTLGTGTCVGTEVNVVRSLAIVHNGTNGAQVVYATTDGPGPNNLSSPVGGNVWVTTNATAVSGTTSNFGNVTLNGPAGVSINPNQFPISSVAIDTSDVSGNSAYVTVMGFTGGPGHVWQTTNAGASWIDFTGTASNALPDSPVNAVVVDPVAHMVYVGTDVGVFGSSTSAAAWTEVGAIAGPSETGFLPNVAVTALAIFNSGGQKLLRASTYGRGVWEFNLLASPDFQIAVSNTPLTVFLGSTAATFNGAVTALNGYNNAVELSCTPGSSSPPSPCTPSPVSLTPNSLGSAFLVIPGTSAIGDFNFNVQGAGSDPNNTTHIAAVTLHVVNIVLTSPLPTVIEPRGATSPPVSFQVTAQGSFNQSVTLSCNFTPVIDGATCAFTPGGVINPTSILPVSMSVTVTVPATTPARDYTVTLQATTAMGPAPLTTSFILNVTLNPVFVMNLGSAFPNVKAGSTGTTGPITIASQDQFAGTVSLNCVTTFGPGSCSIDSSVTVAAGGTTTATLTINGTSFSPGSYQAGQVSVQGTSGSLTNSLPVPFNVGDYTIAGPSTFSAAAGTQVSANLTFTSIFSYSGQVSAACDATALIGAQCTFTPQTLTPHSPIAIASGASVPETVTMNIPSGAIPGEYNIKINSQDLSGAPSHSLTTMLTVHPDFALSALAPSTQTVPPGQSAIYNFSAAPIGASFTNAVSLSCSGGPPGSSCSFIPNPVTPGSNSAAVAMTITTAPSSSAGIYSLVVTGMSGSLSHSVQSSLTVSDSLQLAPTQAFPKAADAGSQQSAKVSLTPNYNGSVNVSCAASVQASQCSVSSSTLPITAGTPATLTLVLNVPNSAAPAPSNAYSVVLTVVGASGGPSKTLSLPLTVIQDFALGALTPATQTIAVGQSATYNFSVLPVGTAFSSAINLSCFSGGSSLCTFTPNSVTPNSGAVAVVMTINTTSSSANISPPGPGSSGIYLAFWIALPALALFGNRRHRITRAKPTLTVSSLLGLFLLAWLLVSCGGGGSNGGSTSGGQVQSAQPGTYSITVTGASGTLSHQAPPVTLIVN
jgi:hypothetical protein